MQPAADSSLMRLASRPGGGPTSFTFFGGILLTFPVVGDIPTTAFEFDGGGGEHCSSSPPQSDTDIDCSSTKPASRRMAGDHAATSRSTLSNWRCNQPGLRRTSGGELAGIGADPFHRAFQAQLLPICRRPCGHLPVHVVELALQPAGPAPHLRRRTCRHWSGPLPQSLPGPASSDLQATMRPPPGPRCRTGVATSRACAAPQAANLPALERTPSTEPSRPSFFLHMLTRLSIAATVFSRRTCKDWKGPDKVFFHWSRTNSVACPGGREKRLLLAYSVNPEAR